MEALLERCAGLDVHKDTVVACVLVGPADGRAKKEVRTFSTVTAGLVELAEWLKKFGCSKVGMESTGCYWRPVYEVLEEAGGLELIVGNAAHMKNVPGRKTDVKDAEWIARLIRMGLVRKSFVPPREQRDARDLVRYRKSLVRARADERNRLQKLLETANIKLGSVATDVFGKSGMAMLKKLAEGETDAAVLAGLAQGLLRKKIPELMNALHGKVRKHHQFLLTAQLRRIEQVDADIALVEAEIDRRQEKYADEKRRLSAVPGIKGLVASALLAELGPTLETFPSAGHLAAWAGVSPGNNQSAGKNLGATTRRGNLFVKGVLIEAAQTAVRKKGSYLKDKFHKLKARLGYMRALIAIARKLCIAVFHILHDKNDYRDLGDSYLDGLDRSRTINSLLSRLRRLGMSVEVTTPAEANPGT